jgi:hypothetical protein
MIARSDTSICSKSIRHQLPIVLQLSRAVGAAGLAHPDGSKRANLARSKAADEEVPAQRSRPSSLADLHQRQDAKANGTGATISLASRCSTLVFEDEWARRRQATRASTMVISTALINACAGIGRTSLPSRWAILVAVDGTNSTPF